MQLIFILLLNDMLEDGWPWVDVHGLVLWGFLDWWMDCEDRCFPRSFL